MTTFFSRKPRRDDRLAALVVQKNLDDMAKIFDDFVATMIVGGATVNALATTAVVTHNFGTTAYRAVVTPTADPGSRVWISGKTATQFTINIQVAPAGAVSFDWLVKGA